MEVLQERKRKPAIYKQPNRNRLRQGTVFTAIRMVLGIWCAFVGLYDLGELFHRSRLQKCDMLILQLLTAIFAVACAWLNKWPVIIFRSKISPGHPLEKEFHAANAAVKALWAAMLTTPDEYFHQPLWHRVAFFSVLLLVEWLVFDIALNLFTGKPPFYLGSTAFLDKLVKNGTIKAVVVLILIIVLNFLLWQHKLP